MSERAVELEVLRYNPETDTAPHFQRYSVSCREEWVVLDALNHVKENIDPTLSYRWSCHMAVCGSCGMMINGEPKLACKAFLRDYPGVIRVEPLAHFPVERDLVTVIDDFMDKLKRVKPYLIPKEEKAIEAGEYQQTPAQLKSYKQFTLCINCMLCYAACPEYGLIPKFIGPAAISLAHRYNQDSRDGGRARAPGGDRRHRGRLGMLLHRRLLRGLPGARRSGRRAAAGQDQEHHRLVPRTHDAMAEPLSRKPYLREVPRTLWFLRHPRYVRYMAREFSCLFIGAYTLMLVVGLKRLAEGPGGLCRVPRGARDAGRDPVPPLRARVLGVSQHHLVQADAQGAAGAAGRGLPARPRDRRRALRRLGAGLARRALAGRGVLSMAQSNKPIVWGPFAAGGTLTAFLTPALILLTLLAGLGHVPELLAYDALHGFVSHWLVKLGLVVVIFLSLWSAAHRLRITCYDLGLRADTLVATLVYALALAGTFAAAVTLLRL